MGMKCIVFVAMLAWASCSFADNIIIDGDLRITNGGQLVFPDGSVQTKAELQGPQGVKGDPGATVSSLPASSIVLDKAKTSLSSDNVQSAIEEMSPSISNLSTLIVGSWNVTYYNSGLFGTIAFSADGSYSMTYSVTGSSNAPITTTGIWSITNGNVLKILNTNASGATRNAGYGPYFYMQKISSNRIDATGSDVLILQK